ncbi:probable splicing factor, arginine/serine-rich 7 isoform X5 [Liolophura sinensis]|uniref:probable splicing factor, arginine/serine-rich 7 isoform X5 n=1 Tax=Liolophura sinensis TaxID=3198878 RepID=UPI0031587734
MNTSIIQVTNVAPTATREQMKNLFSFIGKVEELKLYPSEDILVPVKVCFVRFEDSVTAGVALHLTNTVFIDRALAIGPYHDDVIPDEGLGLQISLQAAAGTLPGNSPSWPSNIISKVQGAGPSQVITTNDPKLTALGLPQYPPLPGNTDPSKIEEIRRTVYVGNLDSTVTAEKVLNFFTQAGEVKFVRMAGDDTQPVRFAFVEFSDQRSIPTALTYNGVMFAGRPLKVNHSNNAIVKPHVKPEAAQREIDEAMKKVKEAQSLISAAIDPGRDKFSRSRSRSRSRRRRSRSRSRKSPSRSRRRSRSRTRRSRSRTRRSRSRKRSRSRSRTRRRGSKSRSKSRSRRSRSKKRSRSRTRHSSRSRRKTPPRAYSRRKSRSTSPSRSKKRRSRSRTRKHRSKSPEKKKSVSQSPSPPKLKKEGSPCPKSPSRNRDGEGTKPNLAAESDKESASLPQQDGDTKTESIEQPEVDHKPERSSSGSPPPARRKVSFTQPKQ